MKIRAMLALVLAVTIFSAAPGLAGYATLRYRDEGANVRTMQEALTALGYDTGGTDGKFGRKTEAAVKEFQEDQGLTADGLAGHQTLTRLYALTDGDTTQQPDSGGNSTGSSDSSGSGSTGSSVAFGSYDTMRYGASGTRVKTLQNALNQLGYACGTVDGKYGAGTQRAVTAFQRDQRLTADGIAGKATLTRIEALLSGGNTVQPETPAPEEKPEDSQPAGPIIPTRTMRKGCTGDDVKSVQTRLKELGYYTGSIDGICSSAMISAVKAFQQKNGLTADGLAGTKTYKILYSDKAIPADTDVKDEPETPTDPSAIIPTRTLYRGATGDDVYSVSLRLKTLGFLQEATYTCDSAMIAAVKKFQQAAGLTADGIAGPKTYEKLYDKDFKLPEDTSGDDYVPETFRNLYNGMTGADVTSLQNKLKALKYEVSATGTYDAQTITAVKAFQLRNGLTVDGIAGKKTQEKLYSGDCVTGDTVVENESTGSTATGVSPNGATIQLLHWTNDIKPVLKTGQNIIAYEPVSGISFTLYVMSRGRHCDVEPLTAADTALMMEAWGGKEDWTPKPVYIKLPDGRWSMATMHNVAHGSQTIKDNNFNGQNCVHFLRDMEEAKKNDPNYGVQNQEILREAWKALTGETVK